jgi:hypothetical protein
MHLDAYDRIRARIEKTGFTPEIQTRITLFLCASKAVNIPFLALAGLAPAGNLVWQALNTQLFRESEAMTLVARSTQWSLDPLIYYQSTQLAQPLYREAARSGFRGWSGSSDGSSFEALAFGHALLATIRLTPIIPQEEVALTPYPVALMRIEQENGRLLQTQIRLLKDGPGPMPIADRETMIAEKITVVDSAFSAFLSSLV